MSLELDQNPADKSQGAKGGRLHPLVRICRAYCAQGLVEIGNGPYWETCPRCGGTGNEPEIKVDPCAVCSSPSTHQASKGNAGITQLLWLCDHCDNPNIESMPTASNQG